MQIIHYCSVQLIPNTQIDANVDSIAETAVDSEPEYEMLDAFDDAVYSVPDDIDHSNEVTKKIPKLLPISVDELGMYVLDFHKNFDEKFKDQYQVRPTYDMIITTIKHLDCSHYMRAMISHVTLDRGKSINY